MRIDVRESVLNRNEALAAENRRVFHRDGVRVLNVLSSPGSGKTALLERTLCELRDEMRMAVVVGDLATENDAMRLRRSGAPAVQITTGDICHLEAQMVARACEQLDLAAIDLLFIENVGNLVCPCSYDLGEDFRVVLLSVTEGEDKPLKYPTMFKSADVVVLTKTDIAEAVGFDRASALDAIRRIAPQATVLEISSRSGAGMDAWYDALRRSCAAQMWGART
jgi:hydrogenase nickel incorporation protein HypB